MYAIEQRNQYEHVEASRVNSTQISALFVEFGVN